MRNEPKTEKMGQHTKSTPLELPHTDRPHGRVPLASLDNSLKQSHTGVSLPSPSLVQFGKRPLLRALRHFKAYKYTLKEEEKGAWRGGSKELLKGSRSIHLKRHIHHQY
ncbi:RNA polymerase sigma-32 factor [Gossypium arboreum]|uniref:RNA polymerase sigma-32 factor n=1 Tax=Gossypium arboreum TaxID=29729 RepID=A0A0B0NA07_GOSAR|nr:RNA polymerase sigma-32 factor [Gossypium arboreum]